MTFITEMSTAGVTEHRIAVPSLNWFATRRYMARERAAVPTQHLGLYYLSFVFGQGSVPVLVFSALGHVCLMLGLLGIVSSVVYLVYQFNAATSIWPQLSSIAPGLVVVVVSIGLFVVAGLCLAVTHLGRAHTAVKGPARWVRGQANDPRIWGEMPPRVRELVVYLRTQGYSDAEIGVHELVQDERVFDPVVSTPHPWLRGVRCYHAIYVEEQVIDIIDF